MFYFIPAIDHRHCHFELRWRSLYACPLCTNNDYINVQSQCKNGTRLQRRTRIRDCRPSHGVSVTFTRREFCEMVSCSRFLFWFRELIVAIRLVKSRSKLIFEHVVHEVFVGRRWILSIFTIYKYIYNINLKVSTYFLVAFITGPAHHHDRRGYHSHRHSCHLRHLLHPKEQSAERETLQESFP